MTSPLIDPAELASRLGDVTVLDVRYTLAGPDRVGYLEAHVPGAVYVDLDTDLADPRGPGTGRHPLPDPDRFVAAMRGAGVCSGRTVVVYDGAAGMFAARAWWLLRHYGHADVRLLDGGLPGWTAEGHPLESGEPTVVPGDFAGEPGHLPVLDAEAAARMAAEGRLVDARAGERYRGETEPLDPVAGHIPGALNVPTSENVHADGAHAGRFRSPDDLTAAYGRAGVDLDEPVGVYCGSGVTAVHDLIALALLGKQAALYPGSWSEWVADPARPVETGG